MVNDSELQSAREHVEHRFTNTNFKLVLTHGDKTTQFEFNNPPRNFSEKFNELLAWLPVLAEKLEPFETGIGDFDVTRVTATYQALPDDFVIFADATNAPITIMLPDVKDGKRLLVVKTDSGANAVTVEPLGTDTIEGVSSISLAAQFDKTYLVGDSVRNDWYRFKSSELI